jgi:carboxypeptidase family protein
MKNALIRVSLLFMLGVAAPLAAADLRGQVLRGNGTPAANVSVALKGPQNRSTTTNASGFYRFPDIPAGTYLLSIKGRNEQEQIRVPAQGTERNFRVQ